MFVRGPMNAFSLINELGLSSIVFELPRETVVPDYEKVQIDCLHTMAQMNR